MSDKKYRLNPEDMKRLIEHDGACIATNRITVDGCSVDYLYREPPGWDGDTGWRMMAGDESDEYMDDPNNHDVHALNSIANYDNDIAPLIEAPVGSAFARNPDTGQFERVESPVDPDDCLHPDYPVVTGDYQLTGTWSVSLPLKFSRREEDGAVVLWRPGLTIYIVSWNNDDEDSIDSYLSQIKSDVSRDAFEKTENRSGAVTQFSYRLVEDDGDALYGFAIVNSGHLQVSIYFDEEDDVELVRSIFASMAHTAGS
ncbi:MAG: hypothetical protein ACI9G1_003484 [Pirellulaceae bacterium]|jgi:hypothetical protein